MLLNSLLLIVCIQNSICEEESGPRVIGGTAVRVEDYPFMVAVLPIEGVCAGSMITLQWVLTAAHCIRRETLAVGIKVRAGFNSSAKLIQIRYAKTGIIHPKFRRYKINAAAEFAKDIRYDIALLKLDKPFRRTSVLNTISLPTMGYTKTCRVAEVCGIGDEGPGPGLPDIDDSEPMERPLKCARMHTTGGKNCHDTFVNAAVLEDGSVIYTLEAKGMKDACKGDSGGPLICNNVVIGVISAGAPCGTAGKCASYTAVEYYLGFIRNSITKTKYTGGPGYRKQLVRKSGVGSLSVCQVSWLAILLVFNQNLN